LELANLLLDTGDSRAALACLKWLVGIRPDLVSGWLNLAVAQFTRGHYQEGISSCHTALSRDPKCVMALYNLGLAHEHLGQFETALDFVRQARQFDPSDSALQRLELRLWMLRLHRSAKQRLHSWLQWMHFRRP
jgi:tetratricopeptide (TPR) repeat protein